MGRPESVVDVDVAVRRQRLGVLVVVCLFLRMEAQVLEHQHLAGLEASDGIASADSQVDRR